MQLVADRFIVDSGGQGIDLATGDRVCVRITSAGGITEQTAWAERCAWLSSVAHPSLAALLDYGPLGDTKRFEAWQALGPWTGAAIAARAAVARALRFLDANGRTSAESGDVVACHDGCPRVIAAGVAGLATDTGEPQGGASHRPRGGGGSDDRFALGIVRPVDRRLHTIGEILGSDGIDGIDRLTAMAVWAPDVAATDLAVRVLARAGRLAGYVPVATGCVVRAREAVAGRSLLLIAREAASGWRCAIHLASINPRPHVVLFAGNAAVRRVHTIRLRPLAMDVLIAAVRPQPLVRSQTRSIAAAARRSHGWLHRFESLLFAAGQAGGSMHPVRRLPSSSYDTHALEPARAAEQAAAYATPGAPTIDVGGASTGAWSAPGEILRLQRQLASARGLLEQARHQPAERALRQVMHAFARRNEWSGASHAALLLAGSLTRRGRVAAAQAVLDASSAWTEHTCDVQLSQRAGLLRAHTLLEQGRSGDAQSLLETVLAAAVSLDSDLIVDAGLAVVRCLYWQGRYTEAWQRLSLLDAETRGASRDQVRVLTARSRVAIGLDRVADAVAHAARARDLASTLEDAGLSGAALYACALAQFAASDRLQAEAAAAHAADAARRGHDPMLALVVRILRAEIARQAGHRGPAMVLVRRAGRLPASALPQTVRSRIDLLRESVDTGDATAAAERRAGVTGLHALRLFAPPRPGPHQTSASAEDIAELMRCCQVADEDAAVLAAVCAHLRRRLRAAGVAFFVVDREQLVLAAGEGSRIDRVVPARVLTANQLVLPHAGERVDAGVPVRYAGRIVGVLAATWMPTVSWHAGEISLLLSVGATAAGPALSGVMARRTADLASRTADLIGVSSAIADVRRAVERAAPAPFAVLVEGESGCGKELVARLLHKLGPRRDRPFSTLNCAALPEDLVESELFGHARGAFTGAAGERRGVFEDAHTGTLFLDEIGELSPRAQAKLLRAIQEGEIRRVGENVCRRVDVRLVTATNRDLRAEVAAGRFRADLLYRLDVVRLVLPPLRERRDDITVLAEHFWREAALRVGSQATLGASTIAALSRYDWPGNIRELQNVLAALVVRCAKRGVVLPEALPRHFAGPAVAESFRLDAARRLFDRSFVRAALVRAGGQRTRAAEQLGVSRQGLAKLMARLEIDDGAGGA